MSRFIRAATLSLALILPIGAVQAEEMPYMAVLGAGEASQAPDAATVTAVVEAEAETTGAASAATTALLMALTEGLADLGIEETHLRFDSPRVVEVTDYVRQPDGSQQRVVTGFASSQGIEVSVRDLDQLGGVVAALAAGGAQISSSVQFTVDDTAALHAAARAAAVADARQKAEDYAAGSGRTLGALVILEESNLQSYRLTPTLQAETAGRARDEVISVTGSRLPAVPLTPQPVRTEVTIYAKYALED